MKTIRSKPCKLCGIQVLGIRRMDRKSFYYPNRCPQCSGKFSPEALLVRRRVIDQIRRNFPIGSIQNHNSGNGLIYRRVKIGEPNIWDYEHRAIMSQLIGRQLKDSEQVHHIDGNTLNNSPENLQLLTRSEHTKEHLSLKGRWSLRFSSCVDCGTTEKPHLPQGRCSACYQRHRYQLFGAPKRS